MSLWEVYSNGGDKSLKRKRDENSSGMQRNKKQQSVDQLECWICGKMGHLSRDCKHRKVGK